MSQSFPNSSAPPPNEQQDLPIPSLTRVAPTASTRAVEAMQRSLQAFMLLSNPQNPTVKFLTLESVRTATSSIYGQQPNMVNVQRNAVDFGTHVNSRHPELLHGNRIIQNRFQFRNSVNSESHGTSMNPTLAYGNKNFQNRSLPNMVGAESNFVNSMSHATSMRPSLLYGSQNIQNRSQTTIHSGNIQHVAAPVQQQLSMSQNMVNQMSNFQEQRQKLHGPTLSNLQPHSVTMQGPTMSNFQLQSPTLQGPTTLPFSIPSSEELSSKSYIPESSSTGKLLPGTIQRITVTPAPSAPTTPQNNKGVVINQNVDNTAKQGEKEKEPKLKRRGRPPKRQGYDLSKLPKMQKIGESSSGSGKAESSVTPQKEQMTGENVNKEDQIASNVDSQVESR
ncbi:hypothetical protein TSUD_122400 [Trifolium subterraneum]|nr:hypothetical protein TSUD_122400 [Trifolium subterraneum]